jgi:hypothetical protein
MVAITLRVMDLTWIGIGKLTGGVMGLTRQSCAWHRISDFAESAHHAERDDYIQQSG